MGELNCGDRDTALHSVVVVVFCVKWRKKKKNFFFVLSSQCYSLVKENRGISLKKKGKRKGEDSFETGWTFNKKVMVRNHFRGWCYFKLILWGADP